MGLKYGFSEEVIRENVHFLMDQGRDKPTAERIARAYAAQSKKKLKKAEQKRKDT